MVLVSKYFLTLGQPRSYTNGFFHIDVDEFPNLVSSKGFIFENSFVPFF
jgi:hypothetical protein